MTEQIERSAEEAQVISEAVSVIDDALAKMLSRELISSGEVADLLLDVRTALTAVKVGGLDSEPQAPAPA